jgi:hypothetical protein
MAFQVLGPRIEIKQAVEIEQLNICLLKAVTGIEQPPQLKRRECGLPADGFQISRRDRFDTPALVLDGVKYEMLLSIALLMRDGSGLIPMVPVSRYASRSSATKHMCSSRPSSIYRARLATNTSSSFRKGRGGAVFPPSTGMPENVSAISLTKEP